MVSGWLVRRAGWAQLGMVVAGCVLVGAVMLATFQGAAVRAEEPSNGQVISSTGADVDIIETAPFTFVFSPTTILIAPGTTVTWTNSTGFLHTSTSDVASTPNSWNSSINPGGVFTFTFNTPGTFTYHCAIHLSMTGSIMVEAPVVYLPVVFR